MHLDGARLWEAVAAGAGSLLEYSACFDSVAMCFTKGLGAPVGGVLVGSKDFIKRARWIRQSIGGNLRQAGVLTSAAQAAVDGNFPRALGKVCHIIILIGDIQDDLSSRNIFLEPNQKFQALNFGSSNLFEFIMLTLENRHML